MSRICSKCGQEKEEKDFYIFCPTICKKCCIARSKAYRKTETGRVNRKKSDRKNRLKREGIIYKNEVSKIKDRYVIRILRLRKNLTTKEIRDNPSIIEIKRTEILIHRIKNKLKSKPTGRLKKCTCCLQIKDEANFKIKRGKPISQCRDCVNMKLRNKYSNRKNDI